MIFKLGTQQQVDTESFAGLIFDLDGTLINSMPLHNKAWITVLQKQGYQLDESFLNELAGVPSIKTAEIMIRRFGWKLDAVDIVREKEAYYFSNINLVEPFSEILQIVNDNFRLKPMAIVTGGQRVDVSKVLKTLDLEKLFNVVVCADDTANGKPSPEPFLLAAKKLKVPPENCLVFEDGKAGILGAKNAGMKTIRVK